MSKQLISNDELIYIASNEKRTSKEYLNYIIEKVKFIFKSSKTDGYEVDTSTAGETIKELLILDSLKNFEFYSKLPLSVLTKDEIDADADYSFELQCDALIESLDDNEIYEEVKGCFIELNISKEEYEMLKNKSVNVYDFFESKGIKYEKKSK